MCSFLPAIKVKKNKAGTILIVTLWILAILTVFAIGLGQRVSLELNLAQYHRDKLKSRQLARAAIEKAIAEKSYDQFADFDALNESWANFELGFKEFALGEGKFTISYLVDGITLYGMQDELSKININKADQKLFAQLFGAYDNADEIARAIVAWRTKEQDPEQDSYYQGLDIPYPCKNAEFKTVPELLLVQHLTPAMLYGEDLDEDGRLSDEEQGLARYLTVYGDGAVNINTSTEVVLKALLKANLPESADELVSKILAYRKGDDDEIATEDDNSFSMPGSQLAVTDAWYYYGTQEDLNKLNNLNSGKTKKLTATSNLYTVYAQAEVRKLKKTTISTVDLTEAAQVRYLYWHEY